MRANEIELTIWQEQLIVSAFHEGLSGRAAGERIGVSKTLVYRRWARMGLVRETSEKPRISHDPLKQDLAFKKAMLKAIHDGVENPKIGTVKGGRGVLRQIHGETIVPSQSSLA